MDNNRTFKTKTGFCHILPDRILLTKQATLSEVTDPPKEKRMTTTLGIYLGLGLILLYFSFLNFNEGANFRAGYMGILGVYLLYGAISSRNHSATPVIDRSQITQVKLKKPIPWLTRGRFEVYFKHEDQKVKKATHHASGISKQWKH